MPPLLVGWPFQVHEPGATVDPLALDRSTTRSEIAGVVTTEGPVAVGTGRPRTPLPGAGGSAAPRRGRGCFMGVPPSPGWAPSPLDRHLRGPVGPPPCTPWRRYP